MKRDKSFVFLILFLLLSVTLVLASDYTQTLVYFIMTTQRYYLVPLINTKQNLVKDTVENITITVYKQALHVVSDKTLFPNATITGNFTTPAGTMDVVTFTSTGNGNYTSTYTYTQIGTYRLDITAISPIGDIGYSYSRAYIYVGQFPLYITMLPGTEYIANETGEIDIDVKDADDNPITGGTALIKIWYPNKTLWVNDSQMIEHMFGMYYYNFTVPATTGEYLAYINFTSGSNTKQIMDKFHVAPWAQTIQTIYNLMNTSFYGIIAVDPSIITGTVTLGATYSNNIEIINLGTIPIIITNVTTPVGVTANFTTNTIAASSDKILKLTYNTSTIGSITGDVVIFSNTRGQSTINITINVTVEAVTASESSSGGGLEFIGRGIDSGTMYYHYIDANKKDTVCEYVWLFVEEHTTFTADNERGVVAYTPTDIFDIRDTIARDTGIGVSYEDMKKYLDYPTIECPRAESRSNQSNLWEFVSKNRLLVFGLIFCVVLGIGSYWYYTNKKKRRGAYAMQ